MNRALSVLATSGLLAAVIQLPLPASASTTWDWSFTTNKADQFGSGTFTTADITPTAFTTYNLTGISGTYNREGFTYTISGLYAPSGQTDRNKFQWDGTINSKILVGQFSTRAFGFIAGGKDVSVFQLAAGFAPVSDTVTAFSGTDGSVTNSTLSPRNPVPVPLPVLGIATGLSWSRRLKRRLRARHVEAPMKPGKV